MPRTKTTRRVAADPVTKGFRIIGNRRKTHSIQLFVEENEVIRLLDYEGLTQEQAAEHMSISRPTLTRVYQEARAKIARALNEGLNIEISGGHYSITA